MPEDLSNETKTVREAPDDISYVFACKAINGRYKYKYCIEEDKFYLYRDGYWQALHELELIDLIDDTVRITHLSLIQTKNIVGHMKRLSKLRLDQFNTYPLFNLENYMIDPVGKNVLDHEDYYYSTNRIPYKYNDQAPCELWERTLEEIFEKDKKKIELLQEFFGYCLHPLLDQKKALLLLGDSNSGKSTILATLRNLLGVKNCSSVPLKYISNPQYTPMMVNKLVNIDADVDKNASNYEAEFKMITSGEPINCNQKFVETFEFVPKCKIILAANIFPKITDHSSAFYKRLILIPCERIFEEKEQNRALTKNLLPELPGILIWAIRGSQRLKSRGRFEQYDFMTEAVQDLENENNPVNIFFEEHIEVDLSGDAYIEKVDLFEKYKKWCETTKNYCFSKNRFANFVNKRFHKVTPKDSRLSEGDRPRVWRSLKYVDFIPKDQRNAGWQE